MPVAPHDRVTLPLEPVGELVGDPVRVAADPHLPRRVAALQLLLLPGLVRHLVVPALLGFEPVLDGAGEGGGSEVAQLGLDHRARSLRFVGRARVDEHLVVVVGDDEPPLLELARQLGGFVAELQPEALEEAGRLLVLDRDADAPVVPGHYAGILPYSASVDPTTRSETPVWSRCFVMPPRKNG
jgi:hypothetical protein